MAKTTAEDNLRLEIKQLEERCREKANSVEFWSGRYETCEEERVQLRKEKDQKYVRMETSHSAELAALRMENARLWHLVRSLTADKTIPTTITDKEGRTFPIDSFPGAAQPAEGFFNGNRF